MARKRIASLFLLLSAILGEAKAADKAEILIREGVELRREGRDAEAKESFIQAYETSHSPRAAAQLGLCEQALGMWLEAEAHLEEALTARSDPWVTRNRSILQDSLTAIGAHLATIVIEGTPPAALVSVNGKQVGHLPSHSQRVHPGDLLIEVSHPGFETSRKAVKLEAEQKVRVAIELAPTPPKSSSETVPSLANTAGTATSSESVASSSGSGDSEINHVRPYYRSGWFWTGVAAVTFAAVASILLIRPGDEFPTPHDRQTLPGEGM